MKFVADSTGNFAHAPGEVNAMKKFFVSCNGDLAF
jgi:hypothetical protein